jgi:hypothetical protein
VQRVLHCLLLQVMRDTIIESDTTACDGVIINIVGSFDHVNQ